MYKIVDKNNTGKTLRLMLLAKEKNAIFVCKNPKELREKAFAYGLSDIEFISFEDFLSNNSVKEMWKYHNVVIDEIDAFVGCVLAKTNNTLLTGLTICVD